MTAESINPVEIFLYSGVIAAIVSGIVTSVLNKWNEKETRFFNAKLDAYKEFAGHLESRFTSLTRIGGNLDLTRLAEVSAKPLLLSNSHLNKELKKFLVHVSKLYERTNSSNYDEERDGAAFSELWVEADEIEDLMRKDLGLK